MLMFLLYPWGCECGSGGGHLDGGEHCDSHSSSQTWSSLCHWVQTIPDEMGSASSEFLTLCGG